LADLTSDPAVATCFKVEVDGWDLGVFASCEGLGFEVLVEAREEGGNNAYVHQLPGRVKYTNVKLTRPINGDSAEVARWFASLKGGVKRTTARITAMTVEGQEVASWSLEGVIPVKWAGPQLGVDQVKVATEQLELAHHGFQA
jgi:phage tail-like protein